jgi:hypothetical protein
VSDLVVLVPVLHRPHRVAPLLASIRAATPDARVLFLPDPDDRAERHAIASSGAEELPTRGGWAAKINAGVRATGEPFLLLAADDVLPHPGWFATARAAMRDGVQVVGLNDLIPRPSRPRHATHFLLSREAAGLPCLDGLRGPVCEAYGHWRVDDELIGTATKRGMYRYCADAVVEHVDHPMLGGNDDSTYAKGRASAHADNRLFRRRARLWT